jgi:hypothetical protein
MPAYKPMPLHLETERLRLQPWTESDADELRVLHSERGNGTPTVERAREIIAKQLAATAATGIALLPIRRRAYRQFLVGVGGIRNVQPAASLRFSRSVFGNLAWWWLPGVADGASRVYDARVKRFFLTSCTSLFSAHLSEDVRDHLGLGDVGAVACVDRCRLDAQALDCGLAHPFWPQGADGGGHDGGS